MKTLLHQQEVHNLDSKEDSLGYHKLLPYYKAQPIAPVLQIRMANRDNLRIYFPYSSI